MRLSEEIRLGSLLVAEPQRNDVRSCAIGMANLSVGWHAADDKDRAAYDEIHKRHPWLLYMSSACPVCARPMVGHEAVWHPFDGHVMQWKYEGYKVVPIPSMTIEQLADFIASLEPSEPVSTQTEGRDPVCTEPAEMVCRK